MAEEERNRRFENALATLSELASNQEGRLTALERLAASQDGRMAILEKLAADHHRLLASHERRIVGLSEAFKTVAELSQRHQGGVEELRAAQAEAEQKIAALADAQIRTEEAVAEAARKVAALAESHERLAASQKRLAESQEHSDRRLDALIDIVRDLADRRKPEGGTPDSG
ncbi:MAG TPA: hypothetical protein VG148_16625 [Pyrinomonadaceae bacterium]|nr:hypothetical protein [Pyrinomonadaceae bacterium]